MRFISTPSKLAAGSCSFTKDKLYYKLCERDHYLVRAQRTRLHGSDEEFHYSRAVVKKALDEGAGLLSEDVGTDVGLPITTTLTALNLRSFMCV